jgi:hypothetical protein
LPRAALTGEAHKVKTDEKGERVSIFVAVIGAVLALLQVLVLFILGDMRERIMRLESQQMRPANVSTAVPK